MTDTVSGRLGKPLLPPASAARTKDEAAFRSSGFSIASLDSNAGSFRAVFVIRLFSGHSQFGKRERINARHLVEWNLRDDFIFATQFPINGARLDRYYSVERRLCLKSLRNRKQ